MITAKWKQGFERFYKDVDPNEVAKEIASIGDSATPQDILDKARDESTELHKCFEWDDAIAAEKHRLQQARYVVHFLVIEEEIVPTSRPEIRLFHKTESAEGYKHTKLIVRQENEYEKLLARAWAELRAFKAKYSCLAELQEIFELID